MTSITSYSRCPLYTEKKVRPDPELYPVKFLILIAGRKDFDVVCAITTKVVIFQYGIRGATFICERKHYSSSFWGVLPYCLGTMNEFLTSDFVVASCEDNMVTIVEEITRLPRTKLHLKGMRLEVQFQDVETVSFFYDDRFRFLKRVPIGPAVPHKRWRKTVPFFTPSDLVFEEGHYNFDPELHEVYTKFCEG